MKRNAILLVFALLGAHVFGYASSGADFLAIPVGARAAGLGHALTATSHPLDAPLWNPAGLVNFADELPATSLGFSHQSPFADTNLDELSVAIPTGNNSLGVSMLRVGYPSIDGRNDEGKPVGSVSASDMAFGLSAAHAFGALKAGAQIKMIRQELAGQSAQGEAVDLGLITATPVRSLTVGASVRNLGPKMKFVTERFALPTTLSIGGSYLVARAIGLSLDLENRPSSGRLALNFGTEVQVGQMLTMRSGYLTDLVHNHRGALPADGNAIIGVDGLGGGIGVKLRAFSLDYALAPFGQYGLTHVITISSRFGDGSDDQNHDIVNAPKPAEPQPSERTSVIFDQTPDPLKKR